MALLNDGKYGHDALGSELGPQPAALAGAIPTRWPTRATQAFTYALLPHAGIVAGRRRADARPRTSTGRCSRARSAPRGRRRGARPRLRGLPLGLGALKPLEDGGGLVLRAYEPQGARGRVGLELPAGWKAEAELNLLEDVQGPPSDAFGPFEVRSWLLRRADGHGGRP